MKISPHKKKGGLSIEIYQLILIQCLRSEICNCSDADPTMIYLLGDTVYRYHDDLFVALKAYLLCYKYQIDFALEV